MHPAHASSSAGRLDGRSLQLGGGTGAPFKSVNPAGKGNTSTSLSTNKQSTLAPGRQANSSTLSGPELPSMESIKLLLARYPALGPALQQLDWDEHGRISKTTLLRIISALDGDTLLQQQQTGPAQAAVPNAPEHDRAGIAGSAETAAAAAAAAQPAGTAPSAPAQGPPASSTPAGAAPTALSLADGFAAAWGKLHAGVSSSIFCPTPAADAPTSTSTPTSACGGFSPAAAAAGSMSGSAGSSRRTSLRPTLSIDISSIHVSDSSDSSQEEEEEPPAPAPGQHGPCSHSGGAASTGSHAGAAAGNPPSSSLTDSALFQHTPHPGSSGGVQQGSDSEGAVPAATSSSGGARKQRCSTPGHALHGSMQVFSNPMASGSDGDEEPEGPAAGSAHGRHSMRAAYYSAGDSASDRETEGQQGREREQHRAGAKPGRKAQTPATGLGKPVSIFSTDGSLRHSHAAASAPEGHAHGMRPAHAAGGSDDDHHEHEQQPAAEHQGSTHSWNHKLSKRPPTPGVSLSQPVSIFSGSGSSLEAGIARHGPQHHSSAGSSFNDEAHTHHAVGFAQHQHTSTASTRAGARTSTTQTGRQQQAERPQSSPGAGHKHGWHRKLSQRPPTPGAALGKPISIFSGSGGNAEGGSGSDSGDESPAGEESPREAAGQRMIKFADDHGAPLELGPARGHAKHASTSAAGGARPQRKHQHGKDSSSDLSHAQGDPEGASAASAAAAQAQHKQQQGKGGHQDWGHKLSKRPPTPGVSLAQPVSIFSNSSSRAETPSAAPAPQHKPRWQPTASHSSEDPDDGDNDDDGAGHPGSRTGAPSHPGDSSRPAGIHYQAIGTKAGTSSSRASSGGKGVAATARVAAADASGGHPEQQQQHWHHKLSKRPPTPGVSLGKPVSIFSCEGNTSYGEGPGAHGSVGSTGGSEGSCSDCDGDGHVHFVAAGPVHGSGAIKGHGQERPHSLPTAHWQHPGRGRDRRSSDSECEGCAGRQKVVWAHTPAAADAAAHSSSSGGRNSQISFKEPDQSADRAAESSEEEGCTAPASSSSGRVGGHAASRQQGRHKHSKRAPTPGASLGKPVSIFDDGHSSSGAAAATHAALSAAAGQLTQRHGSSSSSSSAHSGSDGVHIQFSGEHSIPSRHGPRQHSSQDRRVSWGDEPEHELPVHAHQAGHHTSLTSAGAGSVTRHTHSDGSNKVSGSGSAPTKPERRRITWEDSAPADSSSLPADSRPVGQHAGSSAAQVGARRITWDDSAPAGGSSGISAGAAQHTAETTDGRRRVTWEDSDADAPTSDEQPAPARTVSGPGSDGGRLGVHVVSWGREAEREGVVASGVFQHTGSDSEYDGENVEACQAGSSSVAAASAPHAGGAGATAAAGGHAAAAAVTCPGKSSLLRRLKPALVAEAQEQKWQQRMAKRPPTPGDPLHTQPSGTCTSEGHTPSRSRLQSPEPYGDASMQLQAVASTGSSASSTSSTTGSPAAAGGKPCTTKAALLKFHPALAAEAQEQKWQQRMANRPPTPGDPLHTQPNSTIAASEGYSPSRSRMQSPEPYGDASQQEQQQQQQLQATPVTGSSTSTSTSSPTESAAAGGPCAAKAALLKLRPELAAEAQQQKWQQRMANRPPTPGDPLHTQPSSTYAAEGHSPSRSRMQSPDPYGNASQQQQPQATPVTGSSASSTTSSSPTESAAAGRPSAAKAALLKLHPELAAEAQQQKWQQHMANRPPTPGASLLQHNIFADNADDAGGDGREVVTAAIAASSSAAPAAVGVTSIAQGAGTSCRSSKSGSPASGNGSPNAMAGRVSAKAALLKLRPELAAEAQQQQWQQHMSNRPPTPGASLLQPNMFAEEEADGGGAGGRGSGVVMLTSTVAASSSAAQRAPSATSGAVAAMARGSVTSSRSSSRGSSPASGSGSPRSGGGRASAKAALLKLHPELAAEAQQQQWQQHMANRPPTPGASLLQHNMFADDGEDDDKDGAASAASAASSSSVASPRPAAPAAAGGSPGRASSGSPNAPSAAKAALLKLHPELAAEAQQQKWQQHMANRPPTPGASLLQHNIFAEEEGEEAEDTATAGAGAAAAAPGRVSATRTSSSPAAAAAAEAAKPPGSAAGALVLHNPDLALERQNQWEQKLSRRPPTPAATLGKPFNMFTDGDEDDIEEQQQAAVVMLQQPPQAGARLSSRSSSGGISGSSVTAVGGIKQAANETLRRSLSPDQARSASNSSNGSSSAASSPTRSTSAGAAPSPAQGAAPAAKSDSDSSTDSSSSRPGSSNPGRQRGSSPLRNTTTAAEVAEQQDRATHSPLRHSSSLCDPDPARMSPLGRRGSSVGNSPASSMPSTPSAAAAVVVVPAAPPATATAAAVTATATAATATSPAVGDGPEMKGARQGQAGSGEPHSPSRLGRSPSPSPSVLDRETGGPASLVQRSSSPLGRSTSTNQAAASPVRHGSPLSRCSSGGMC